MGLKNFKTRNGIDVDTYTIPNTVIQQVIKTNNITTVDTIAMSSFVSAEYLITITQGSKIRTSSVILQTDGTSVDMTEYGIFETGGTISGVVVSATTSSTNAVLQITITDAASTIARVKINRNINVIYTPTVPDAPTIGTATASSGSASITFTAPYDNGGASISSYRATSTPGSITGTASSSPVTVSGLTAGTSYTFVVAAINSAGVSAASSASNSVTPPSAEAGYFAGGSASPRNAITKLLFADDTITTLSAVLSSQRTQLAGMANSGTAGYAGGGFLSGTGKVTTIDKLTFQGETRSTLGTGLSVARLDLAGMANSGTAGYFGGGNFEGIVDTIDKIAFSNDSRSTLGTGLIQARQALAGMANSGTAGYFGGGSNNNIVDKITFSNDSRSILGSGLSSTRSALSAMANSGTAGYFAGGENTAFVTTVNKYAFSNDSRTTLATGLSVARSYSSGMAKSGIAGYIGGGNSSTTVDKFAFSNDSRTTLAIGLPAATESQASFANSGTL